jgi:7-cyano-7-deazaguanine synthase in queuosine biosynthesis
MTKSSCARPSDTDNADMAGAWTLILNSGGLRSAVATALVLAELPKPRVAMVHFIALHRNAAARLQYARRLTEHYGLTRFIELELPRVEPGAHQANPQTPVSPLHRTLLATAAMAQAVEMGANRLIWPVQVNAQARLAAQITEQTTLLSHLTELEVTPGSPTAAALPDGQSPVIETPLLELSDQQVVELGAQLNVPWRLTWSCDLDGGRPCKVCPSCQRRHAAFAAAGLTDPMEQADHAAAEPTQARTTRAPR